MSDTDFLVVVWLEHRWDVTEYPMETEVTTATKCSMEDESITHTVKLEREQNTHKHAVPFDDHFS